MLLRRLRQKAITKASSQPNRYEDCVTNTHIMSNFSICIHYKLIAVIFSLFFSLTRSPHFLSFHKSFISGKAVGSKWSWTRAKKVHDLWKFDKLENFFVSSPLFETWNKFIKKGHFPKLKFYNTFQNALPFDVEKKRI